MKRSVLFIFTTIALIAASCSSKEEKKFVSKAASSVVTSEVSYQAGGKTYQGYLAVPEGEGPFPGVLVVHEWWGQTEYPRERAEKLAEQGYVAFAVDMYGEGKTFDHPKDAKEFSSKVMADLDGAEENFRTALATLKLQDKVNKDQIAALGYCFGGAIVLEMARRGVDLKMVASYHGNLTPLVKNPVKFTQTRFLIFNGGADPFVKEEDVNTVRTKLKGAKIRYKLMTFKGAKHAFTNPKATEKGKEYDLPLAYNQRADEKSWDETLKAFKIVFQ